MYRKYISILQMNKMSVIFYNVYFYQEKMQVEINKIFF